MAARADPFAERAQLVLPRLGGPLTPEEAVPFERRGAQALSLNIAVSVSHEPGTDPTKK